MNRITPEQATPLAQILAKNHPDLIHQDEVKVVAQQIAEYCLRLILGRDNDRRLAATEVLIAKRSKGEEWTDEEEDQADFYGVAGPRRTTVLANGVEVPTRMLSKKPKGG